MKKDIVTAEIIEKIKTVYGRNSFAMSPTQWIKRTNAIGIISNGGRYSIGIYAHSDIAFEFASWLSPEFKLYLITEFERLKANEAYQEKIDWQSSLKIVLVLCSKFSNIVFNKTI
ncbi:MAG: KilA-N domain-containing protein, partial [Bacilli bacterium]|nr:KilA-N domain-containing protein [Bacilli bacterium]